MLAVVFLKFSDVKSINLRHQYSYKPKNWTWLKAAAGCAFSLSCSS